MSIYKPPDSKYYHYDFIFNGVRIQRSSRLTNREHARNEEARHRTCLVKGEVFVPSWKKLAEPEPGSVPAIAPAGPNIDTLTEFKDTFMAWVCSVRENPKTIQFYETCYMRLCSMIGNVPLNEIDEPKIEILKLRLLKESSRLGGHLTRTTVNRHLATLRKALRYAALDLRKFDRVPRIRLYEDEPGREYTYSDDDYHRWLEIAPEPLRSASILARECGICRGELLALRRDTVVLHDYADNDGLWGKISVVRGLKRKARKRELSITREMTEVLREQMKLSQCEYVFSALEDRKQPLSPNTLGVQHTRVMATGQFHPGAGLHALRHTFLTEAGRETKNVRALMRIAGHSQISTTMKYVHPEERDMIAISVQVQRVRQQRAEERSKKETEPTQVQTPPVFSPIVQ